MVFRDQLRHHDFKHFFPFSVYFSIYVEASNMMSHLDFRHFVPLTYFFILLAPGRG